MKVNHGYQHFCKEPPAVNRYPRNNKKHNRGVLQYGLPLHTVQVHVTRVIDLLSPRLGIFLLGVLAKNIQCQVKEAASDNFF